MPSSADPPPPSPPPAGICHAGRTLRQAEPDEFQSIPVDRQSGEFDPWILRAEMGRRLSQAIGMMAPTPPIEAEMQAAAERLQQAQAAAQAYQASMAADAAAAWSAFTKRVMYPGRAG